MRGSLAVPLGTPVDTDVGRLTTDAGAWRRCITLLAARGAYGRVHVVASADPGCLLNLERPARWGEDLPHLAVVDDVDGVIGRQRAGHRDLAIVGASRLQMDGRPG